MKRPSVLIVDDDPDVRAVLREVLAGEFRLAEAADCALACTAIDQDDPEVVLLDLNLGAGPDGFDVLEHVAQRGSNTAVIVLSDYRDPDTVVRAMKSGAAHYVSKTPRYDELLETIRVAREERRRRLTVEARRSVPGEALIGESAAMAEVRELITTAAGTEAPVLILGETGTGKGLIARSIHRASPRRAGHYEEVNIAGEPSTLLDSALFGHQRGAFTGADRMRRGFFELADGGTLLLDEIGDLPAELQVKLLRVVEERRIRRIGAERETEVDVRMLAATHRDLQAMLEARTFREDLFHRLAVLEIRVPPLRERRVDVPKLVEHFAGDVSRISADAMAWLRDYSWPGNVRELRHMLQRAALLARGRTISVEHLRPVGREPATRSVLAQDDLIHMPYDQALATVCERFRENYLARLLEATQGNVAEAARRSGLSRGHLHKLLRELGVRRG